MTTSENGGAKPDHKNDHLDEQTYQPKQAWGETGAAVLAVSKLKVLRNKSKKKAHNRVVPYDNEDAETNRLVLV